MFCFSCQKLCPFSVRCRLWVLGPLSGRPFCLLSPSEDQDEQRLAIIGAVGIVHGSQSFDVCCTWGRWFPCRYPSALSFWEKGEPLLKEAVQTGLQEVSWRLREMCVVHCCREVSDRLRVELFLPSCIGWWRRSCPYATVWHVALLTPGEKLGEGCGDGGLQVGISVVCARAEAAGADLDKDFVRDPAFTQRNFLSETVVTILPEAAATSDGITSSSV